MGRSSEEAGMMELVVFENCPFCHRCLLALEEKAAAFKVVQVERSSKQEATHLLSPYARVPVLWHDARPIHESSIINEYLEDVLPTPALLPRDPIEKAAARFWIDFCNTRFMPAYFNLLKERDATARVALRAALIDHLRFVDKFALAKVSDAAPYWMGEDVTLVDYSFYPFFERFVAVELYRDVTIPADLEGLHVWRNAVLKREVVRKLARGHDYYVERYANIYADA
jgi:glutathione S-transferase